MASVPKRTRSQTSAASGTLKRSRASPSFEASSLGREKTPPASPNPEPPAAYTISDGMVDLVYNDATPSAEPKEFAKTPVRGESSSSESSPSSTVTMSKDKLEDYRKKLYAVITEYGEKLNLLGVTIKKYGPGTMKPLAYKLGLEGYGTKTTNEERVGGASPKDFIKKLKTRKLTKNPDAFDPKIISQTNEKQRREARMLQKLFHKLQMDDVCNGKQLKNEIVDRMHTPYRYIYLFLKTIDNEQYVVGFVSATQDASNPRHAVVDYVCPNVTVPTDSVWKESDMLPNFAAYVVLNFLWLNNATRDAPRYEKVTYDGAAYSNAKDVFRTKKLKTFPHINTYAATIMNFKMP